MVARRSDEDRLGRRKGSALVVVCLVVLANAVACA